MANEVAKLMNVFKSRRSRQRLENALNSIPDFLKSDIGVEGAPVIRPLYGPLQSAASVAQVSTAHRQNSTF